MSIHHNIIHSYFFTWYSVLELEQVVINLFRFYIQELLFTKQNRCGAFVGAPTNYNWETQFSLQKRDTIAYTSMGEAVTLANTNSTCAPSFHKTSPFRRARRGPCTVTPSRCAASDLIGLYHVKVKSSLDDFSNNVVCLLIKVTCALVQSVVMMSRNYCVFYHMIP